MNYKKFIIFSALILVLFGSEISSETTAVDSLVPKDLPEGWVLVEGPQIYTKKTLFKHIDGQAELFFKYGYQKSIFTIYQDKKNPGSQIELDIYDMGNVLQAFGIFSRFRNEERPEGVGLDSYFDDRSALFYKGKYFVMLYATDPKPTVLKDLAMRVSQKILDNSPPPKEIGYFPKEGLKPSSIQYFPEGLLGHQFLKRGFQATYIDKVKVKAEAESKDQTKTEDKDFHLFLAILGNSQMAMNGLKAYKEHLLKKGKIESMTSNRFGPTALRGKDPYQGKVIVIKKGFYLLGAVGFEREKEIEDRLTGFVKNIK